MKKHCRWGILGAANIARKNWKAIRCAENATLVAVASRDRRKAQQFVEECQGDVPFPSAPGALGSYEELLSHPDIDAVYIPIPTGIRKDWVVKAAQAGKHVLCEKPCGSNLAEVEEMVAVCAKNKVQFMDGVMFMHSQRLPQLRAVLDDGKTIGQIRRVTSEFSFAGSSEFLNSNIRVDPKLEPLGCLGDLGWYNIRFALWTMNYAMPETVSGRMLAEYQGVPLEFSGELFFPGGTSASFYCSFQTELQTWATISGALGSVRITDFMLPAYGCEVWFETSQPVFNIDKCSYHYEQYTTRHAVREHSDGHATAQESRMIAAFSQLVLDGRLEHVWGERSLKTQAVLDACLRSARQNGALVRM